MKIFPIYFGNVPTQKNSGQMSLNLSKPIFFTDFSFGFKDVFFGVVELKTDKDGKYFIIILLFLLAK